jgi:hypothetical protein
LALDAPVMGAPSYLGCPDQLLVVTLLASGQPSDTTVQAFSRSVDELEDWVFCELWIEQVNWMVHIVA